MSPRFTSEAVEQWRVDGAVLLPSFFKPEEIGPVERDFAQLYSARRPTSGTAVDLKLGGAINDDTQDHSEQAVALNQFEHTHFMPFDSSAALNLIALHPALIEFAKAALGVSDVRLYLCTSWAKFTGQTNFEQKFHMDYWNHTLIVPGDTPSQRSLDFSIYASDVTDGHGAIHYVRRPEGDNICGIHRPWEPGPAEQQALLKAEQSGAGPIGSVFAYSTDVYHRATNLTVENGHRYTVFCGYKAADNDACEAQAWPSSGRHSGKEHDRLWSMVFEDASPEQLACLNIPGPGHFFWTDITLARAQHRYPRWNLDPWRRALAAGGQSHKQPAESR